MTAELAKPSNGRRRALIAIAGLGVLVYLAAAVITDADRLEAALLALGWGGTALVLGASALNYLLRFGRWSMYIRELGHDVPRGRHLLYYLCGFAFTVSPGKAGEAVRSLYLREHGVRYPDSIAALFVERVLDLMAIALIACLIVLKDPSYWPVLVGALGTTLALVVFIGRPQVARGFDRLGARRSGRIAAALTGIANLLRSSKALLTPRLLLSGLVLGVVAWGAEGVGFYWILQGLAIESSIPEATGIYGVSVLAGGAAFFMPGGIGGMEVVMPALLVAQGVPLATAVIAMLLCRLATLWFAVVLGLIAATVLETRAVPAPVSGSV